MRRNIQHRALSPFQKLTIYWNTPPALLGETFLVAGVAILVLMYPNLQGLIGVGFSAVGGFFVWKKIKSMNQGSSILAYGLETEAKVVDIQSTLVRHNKKTVMEYTFQYEVHGQKYTHQFRSAFHRELETGSQRTLYYLPSDPGSSFIPELFKLRLD